MSLTYRTADITDAATASRIITLALNDLAARQCRPPLAVPEDHATPVLRHLIGTDGARFWVADDGDRPVGFGAALVRGRLSYCYGLFVLPEWQRRGVGRSLFERAFEGLPVDGGVSALASSAANPASNALYARHGIYPLFALLYLTGPVPGTTVQPVRGRRAPAAPSRMGAAEGWSPSGGGLEAEPLTLAHLDELRQTDGVVLGADRTVDHRWYLSVAKNPGWLFRRRERTVGYAYLGGDATGDADIGPVAALRSGDLPAMLRFALVQLATRGVGQATVIVPGPNISAQRLLWQAGFSFTGATGLFCVSRPFGHLDRYILAGDCLM